MNKKFLILSLIVISSSFILSSCGMEDGIMDATLTQEENADLIEKYRQQNQENLDKIREYDLKEQDKYNGKTNFEPDSSNGASLAESQYKNNTNSTAPSFGSRTKNEDIVEDEGNKLDHWLYYDAEENEWGDVYYYILKDSKGRIYYEYAYSMINGKKKIDKTIKTGAIYSKYLMIGPDIEVPQWVQKDLDKNDVLLIRVDKDITDFPYDDDTYEDLYDYIDHWEERKEEVGKLLEDVKNMYYNKYNWTYVDLDSDYRNNINRRLEDNPNASKEDSALKFMINVIDKYSIDVNKIKIDNNAFKDKKIRQDFFSDRDYLNDIDKVSEDEYTQIQLINNTKDELNEVNVVAWGRIGYESKYVVVRLAGINKIVEREEAYKLIDEVYEKKYDILDKATTLDEINESNFLNIMVPSYYEIKLRDYVYKKLIDFNEKYYEARRNVYDKTKEN